VARLIGYSTCRRQRAAGARGAACAPEAQRSPFAVRRQLAALGYQETINFSFVEERWERELAGNADPIKL
jgi:phenylalanyl-tRNA synthetase beta chain